MADNRAAFDVINRQRRVFAVVESTFGTQVKPTAGDAFRFLSGGITTKKPERIPIDEHRQSRSREAQYTGRTPPTPFSFECELRAPASPGSGGTGPVDVHPFLLVGWAADTAANGGGYTQNASDETYALSEAKHASLCIYEMTPGAAGVKDCLLGKALTGAIVDEVEISGNGTAAPKVRVAGVGKLMAYTTRTTTAGAQASGTTVDITNANAAPVGSLIAFYEAADGTTVVDDNSSAGFLVTANDGTTITVDATMTGVASGDIIAPWAPTETLNSDNVVPPTAGSITIGGTAVPLMEYSILCKNNHMPHDQEAFQPTMTGFHSHFRDVTATFKFRAESQKLGVLSNREAFGNITTAVALGTSGSGLLTLTLKGEMGFEDDDTPLDGTGLVTASFTGLASSANAADELSAVYS